MADQIKTLRMGVDELLYANITTTGVQQYFALPPQSMNWRGHVVFAAAPVNAGGTITTLTFSVMLQMDPQGANSIITPQGVLSQQVLVSAGPNTQSAYSGLQLFAAGAHTPVIVDLSGLGGSGLLALNVTALTLGTATGVALYAHIG